MSHTKVKNSFLFLLLALFFVASCAGKQMTTVKRVFTVPPKPSPLRQPGKIQYWVQASAESGKFLLRSISQDGLSCPVLKVGESSIPLYVRVPSNPKFQSQVCELGLMRKESGAWTTVGKTQVGTPPPIKGEIEFTSLRLPRSKIKKILLLGDTGCRVKITPVGAEVQKCYDPNEWPFSGISDAATKEHADVVVHLGDYNYRESQCPENRPDCRGVVSGDIPKAWADDFFTPAEPLLRSATWVFVRGNHESCERTREGWFRYLDPRPYPSLCSNNTAPYIVKLGTLNLAVIDGVEEENIQKGLDLLAQDNTVANQKIWVLVHRPFLTQGKVIKNKVKVKIPKDLDVGVVMSGHIHELSLSSFPDGRPLEFIVGNGGSSLSHIPRESTATVYLDSFGYITMDRADVGAWKIKVHDVEGKVSHLCQMNEMVGKKSFLACAQAPEDKSE